MTQQHTPPLLPFISFALLLARASADHSSCYTGDGAKTLAHSLAPDRTCAVTSIEPMAIRTTSASKAPVTATTGQGSTSSSDVRVKTGTRRVADAVRCGTFAVRLVF